MRTKGSIKGEIVAIKRQLQTLNAKNRRNAAKVKRQVRRSRSTAGSKNADARWAQVLEYLVEESKATRTELRRIQEKLEQFEAAGAYEDSDLPPVQQRTQPQAVSHPDLQAPMQERFVDGVDAKILMVIQRRPHGMACADDIKKAMGYRWRNAASSRLARLRKEGLLERFQNGHRVYYRYTGGTMAARIQVISPVEEDGLR